MSATNEVPVQVQIEATPNPNSHRFAVNRKVLEGPGRDFPHRGAALGSPLPEELFKMPGVAGVFVGPDFVTVTMQEGSAWGNVKGLIRELVADFVERGEAPVGVPPPEMKPGAHSAEAATELDKRIIEVLDREIRPAVAMDGGDIVFAGFDNGVVMLKLKGSCNGCPSSMMTLRMGIESRLKAQFPEVESVQAVP